MAELTKTWNWYDGEWLEGNPGIIGPRTHAIWLGSCVFDGARYFEAGGGGRLMTRLPSGREFEIGKVLAWAPGALLRFSWRPASVAPDHATEVEVRFEPVGDETRVTVEHRGWDGVPQAHAARHGFPLGPFQARLADHWRGQLRRLAENARNS